MFARQTSTQNREAMTGCQHVNSLWEFASRCVVNQARLRCRMRAPPAADRAWIGPEERMHELKKTPVPLDPVPESRCPEQRHRQHVRLCRRHSYLPPRVKGIGTLSVAVALASPRL
jgi:hypothetical protein